TKPETIAMNATELLSNSNAYEAMANAVNPFGDGLASERILQSVRNFL
ncbi:MAG: UDP-N-acetylglucosamine 2-epimerase (non-hydrolyzing), partial [Cyanobacteria bacterium J06639_18]